MLFDTSITASGVIRLQRLDSSEDTTCIKEYGRLVQEKTNNGKITRKQTQPIHFERGNAYATE